MVLDAQGADFISPLEILGVKTPDFSNKLSEAVSKGVRRAYILFYSELTNPLMDAAVFSNESYFNNGLLPSLVLRASYTFGSRDVFHDMPLSDMHCLDAESDDGLVSVVANAHSEGAGRLHKTLCLLTGSAIIVGGIDDRTLIGKTILGRAPVDFYGNQQTIEDAVRGYLASIKVGPTAASDNYRILRELAPKNNWD